MSCSVENLRRPRSDAPNLEGDVVEIRVGSERRSFLIHTAVIQNSSAFFKAALSERWSKKKNKTNMTLVELPEDDPATFHDYFRYLYAGQFFTDASDEAYTSYEEGIGKLTAEWRSLFHLYVLGVKLQDDVLTLRLLENMVLKNENEGFVHDDSFNETINLLYRGTTSDSPARRLLIDMIVWGTSFALADTQDASLYEPEFLIDLSSVLLHKHNNHVNTIKRHTVTASWYIDNRGHASIQEEPVEEQDQEEEDDGQW